MLDHHSNGLLLLLHGSCHAAVISLASIVPSCATCDVCTAAAYSRRATRENARGWIDAS